MAEKASVPNPEHRVMLWGMARGLTTVFEKCMSFVEGVQIINEPFQCAATLGPEGVMWGQQSAEGGDDYLESMAQQIEQIDQGGESWHGWDDKCCTYKWVKNTLESDYPGKKLVFCKDLISGIVNKYEYLPKGYQHTFIIRNPVKVGLSLHKGLAAQFLPPGTPPEQFDLTEFPLIKKYPGFGYTEMFDFVEHLKKIGEIKSDPIIIDADDVQNNPESIVSQYCERTGIPFSKSLLSWEAGDGCVKRNWIISKGFLQGNQIMNYFDAAFASTGFLPAKDPPASLPPDVVKFAELCGPTYRKMYEMRIKPSK